MFTGFIKETGIVEQVNPVESGTELIIQISPQLAPEIQIDSYIAVDGRILRVLHKENNTDFSLLKLYASHVNDLTNYLPKIKVNLERAIRLGEEIPGTFFYGFPSEQVKIISIEKLPALTSIMRVSFENILLKYLSTNDQVCLDGVSLQIRNIEADLLDFELYPNTLSGTNLGERKPGDLLSLEIDPFTKKIARIFEKLQ